MFRFRDVFIGCLVVTTLRGGADARHATLLDGVAIRAAGPFGATHVAITPQGYGYEADGACPARSADGACSLHDVGKPGQCSAVPLDPLAPDGWQERILRERMGDAVFRDAGCLADGGGAPLARDDRVADAGYAAALDRRRRALSDDTLFWGRAVFAALRHGMPAPKPGDFVALPMVPALLVVAGFSERCRLLCLEFLEAQLLLIAQAVKRARMLRRAGDRPVTARLLAWAEAYRDTRAALALPPPAFLPCDQARVRETWLESA